MAGAPRTLILLAVLAPFASSAQNRGPTTAAALDKLFAELKAAPTEQDAAPIEAQIQGLWVQAGSPSARLLISRGLRELSAGANKDAIDDFGAALTLDPDLTEGYYRRAAARYAAGDTAGALHDLADTLKREPRHFDALRLLSNIAEARGDWRAAYGAWQRLLEIDPKARGGEQHFQYLQRRAYGQPT
ncbi:MAG: hypothetical protein JOY71_06950 [Acetobacteraceae bacterium]|nr:hypothetical protein [Acetobacteraceae bacterium]MBV8521849.1 hypothetical protein [Acetobacteraceae bacterium]